MSDAELDLTAQGTLPPCPSSPNCVSSDADPADRRQHIDALRVGDDPHAAWARLIEYLEGERAFTIVERREDFLRVEARTPILRFVDDLLFHLRPDEGVIGVRSASRIGYSDLGKNRSRLEKLRAAVSA